MTNYYYELPIAVSINVLFISLFIALFFFTYGAYIESNIVKEQMNFLAIYISYIVKLFGLDITNNLKYILNIFSNLNFTEEDNKVKEKNKITMNNAIIANILLTIFVIILVAILYYMSNGSVNLVEILIKNFIILIFIGLTEFFFIYLLGSKFISLNPNLVSYNIIDNLQKIYNKPIFSSSNMISSQKQ
jgi:hypothetical protein